MKTLADLKRDAANGKIKFELMERYGKTGDEIPEKLRGIREVEKVNTVGILCGQQKEKHLNSVLYRQSSLNMTEKP